MILDYATGKFFYGLSIFIQGKNIPCRMAGDYFLVTRTGIEPAFTAWEAVVLPIYEPCMERNVL